MAKTPSAKEDEDLRGELRSLIKENRSLRRENKALRRAKQQWEETKLEPEEAEDVQEGPPPPGPVCPDCKRDYLVMIDFGIKRIQSCKICGFRKVIKVETK